MPSYFLTAKKKAPVAAAAVVTKLLRLWVGLAWCLPPLHPPLIVNGL